MTEYIDLADIARYIGCPILIPTVGDSPAYKVIPVPVPSESLKDIENNTLYFIERLSCWHKSLSNPSPPPPLYDRGSALTDLLLRNNTMPGDVLNYYTQPLDHSIVLKEAKPKTMAGVNDPSFLGRLADEWKQFFQPNDAGGRKYLAKYEILELKERSKHSKTFKTMYEYEYMDQSKTPGFCLPIFYLETLFKRDLFQGLIGFLRDEA